MNRGTKIRTTLAIVTSVNTALLATDVTGFNSKTLNTIYTVLSIVCNFVIVALTTYYNNDYTKEAAEGTGYTRALKANRKDPEQAIGTEGVGVKED